MSILEYFISGGFGGMCAVIIGHPFDTIKVRLQTMPIPAPGEKPLYSGTLDCLQKTLRHENIFGLYKGMSAPLATVAPIFAISFMGYGLGKKLISPSSDVLSYPQLFAAGGFAGFFTTVLMAPGERVKVLLQIQHRGPKIYDGPVDCLKKLFKEGGIQSIYRGTFATLARDIPASGTYFLTYEAIQRYLTSNGQTPPSMMGALLAGGAAGMNHWLIGLPADVLKSRLQSAPAGTYPRGMRDVFKSLMKDEGPFALYKGLVPVMLRAVPANAVCFWGFEVCQKMINALKRQLRTLKAPD